MDIMQLSHDMFDSLSNQIDNFHIKINFGDFVTNSERILKQIDIDTEKSIKENALTVSNALYDELDLIFNFNSVMDFAVKNIILPVMADAIEMFLTGKN